MKNLLAQIRPNVMSDSIHLNYMPFIAFLEYSDWGNVLHSYTKMYIKIILQRQLQIDLRVIICWGFSSVKKQNKRRKITREDVFIIYLTTEQTCIILTKCFRSKKVTVYTCTIKRYKTISQLMLVFIFPFMSQSKQLYLHTSL